MLEFVKENLITIIIVGLALLGIIITIIVMANNNKKIKIENKKSESKNAINIETNQDNASLPQQESNNTEEKNTEIENEQVSNEDYTENLETTSEKETIKEENIENNVEENTENNIEEDIEEKQNKNDIELPNNNDSNIEQVNNIEKQEIEDKSQESVNTENTQIVEDVNTPEKIKYIGKWVIVQKAENEFLANLKASNGQIVLTSESYKTAKSAEAGIETIRKNVANGNFQIYTDKKENYFYKLKDSGNKLLCIGEIYQSRLSCEKAVESVKKFAEKSTISPDVIEDLTMIYYKPLTDNVEEDISLIKDQYRGKWVITKDEDLYSATLYASNGQILLNSEKYKLIDSVNKAIENYKKNSIENNFIIDKDKTGKYYYKLRNSQKLTLAVGETYNTQRDCEKAIESFKRFNKIAKIIPYEEIVKPEENNKIEETTTETTDVNTEINENIENLPKDNKTNE